MRASGRSSSPSGSPGALMRISRLAVATIVAAWPVAGQAQARGATASTPARGATPATAARTQAPPRAIRRDIPLTNMIRQAFAAGTRDSSGKPGAKYWQLWMDYTINARFDAPTSTVTGRETAIIHN